MPLRDDLFTPIPGPSPAGADLRYDAVYVEIQEARRADDDGPKGPWERPPKIADWGQIIALASDALATKSKDLQLAAWLTEALLRAEGFSGFSEGLGLLRALLEQFTDSLYPRTEDGDAEVRAAAVGSIGGTNIATAIKSVALNDSGHSFFKHEEARDVGYEAECQGDSARLERRQHKITAEHKLSPEEFDRAVIETPKSRYKTLAVDLDRCIARLEALDKVGQEAFGAAAPGYGKAHDALDQVRDLVRRLLAKKLEIDPDPPEASSSAQSVGAGSAALPSPARDAPPVQLAQGSTRSLGAEISTSDDARAIIVAAARFLRRAEPHNPASYLVLRGLRWGELRAQGGGSDLDPRLLDAPPTHVRTHLKRLLLDRAWTELLEAAETVMGTSHGRGWLDLQRYALTACDRLGSDFRFVAAAIRGELRALLAEIPALPEMTLMDDTPTANPETQRWLSASVLGGETATGSDDGANGNGRASHDRWNARELAQSEVRHGRADEAIEMLMRELASEKSQRGRFLRQSQLAGIMVNAGHQAVAMPMLEEMLGKIEAHTLEAWEAGAVVAEPMALLYRCLDTLDGDAGKKHDLYVRICRLDPVQAIAFTRK